MLPTQDWKGKRAIATGDRAKGNPGIMLARAQPEERLPFVEELRRNGLGQLLTAGEDVCC
jgi:hypothetical protein